MSQIIYQFYDSVQINAINLFYYMGCIIPLTHFVHLIHHMIFSADGDRITGGQTLTIHRAEEDDAGSYTCTVTTDAGSKQTAAQQLIVYCKLNHLRCIFFPRRNLFCHLSDILTN